VVVVATRGEPLAILEVELNKGDLAMLAACALYAFYTVALQDRPDMPGTAFFTLLALISPPSVLKQAGFGLGFDFGDGTVILVAWIAQTFLQLVLLPIIIVGQNIQARAADKRSESIYEDSVAVLHECREIQAHLKAQDEALTNILRNAQR